MKHNGEQHGKHLPTAAALIKLGMVEQEAVHLTPFFGTGWSGRNFWFSAPAKQIIYQKNKEKAYIYKQAPCYWSFFILNQQLSVVTPYAFFVVEMYGAAFS